MSSLLCWAVFLRGAFWALFKVAWSSRVAWRGSWRGARATLSFVFSLPMVRYSVDNKQERKEENNKNGKIFVSHTVADTLLVTSRDQGRRKERKEKKKVDVCVWGLKEEKRFFLKCLFRSLGERHLRKNLTITITFEMKDDSAVGK
ncbi:hypothetical protein BDF14DRAFT_241872 [Spinellus fusiger]|nr:hypothetical protein BDF14DRAFT_241872 [Spinellus fusiger]